MLRFQPRSVVGVRQLSRFARGTCVGAGVFASASSHLIGAHRQFHSLALEQAMRITTPSPKHPATGTPTEEPDATTVWREHWDGEHQRPYYHNLVTQELRTTLPEGFPSRFLFYYEGKGAAALHQPSDHGALPKHATRAKTIKERIKDFGIGGFLLYSAIHFSMLGTIFGIMLCGVDLTGLLRSLGFDTARVSGKSLWALWLAAIVTNKLFVPLQALLTVALAPRAVPVIRNVLVKVGLRI